MKQAIIAVIAIILIAIGAYLFWPRKAGPECNDFRAHYERHCLSAEPDPSCSSQRGMYDDSMRERVNDEKLCAGVNKTNAEYDNRRASQQDKAKLKKETEELYQKLGEPVPDNLKKLYE